MINKKHVLIIPTGHFATPVYPHSGIFEYHQAMALSESGYNVGVISVGAIPIRKDCFPYPYKQIEKLNSINILRKYKRFWLPHRYSTHSILKKRYLALFMEQYQKYVALFGTPDIIHAHSILYSGIIAQEVSKKYGIPYVITEHSSSYAQGEVSSDLDNIIIQCANSSKQVVAVGSKLAQLLNEKYSINCSVLPNVIDDYFISYEEEKNKNITPYTFLNVANLIEIKNHNLLIHAFAKRFKGTNTILKIGGEGYLLHSLKELCKNLNI